MPVIKHPSWKRLVRMRLVLLLLAGILLLLGIERVGLFEGFNSYCYNLAFRLRGVEKVSPQVIIVAIDEKTLREVGAWPLKRFHFAQLLDGLQDAQAVGFTVIMAEESADDSRLAAAAHRHGRVVFPLYVDSQLQLVPPAPVLSRFRNGHVHVEQGIDGFAYGVFSTLELHGEQYESLITTLYNIAYGDLAHEKASPVQPGTITSSAHSLYQRNLLRINYYGPPGTVPTISMADVLHGRVTRETFTNKVVLVGPTTPGVEERSMTPFAEQRNTMPSVEIQATLLSNLIKGDGIEVLSTPARLIVCLLLTGIAYVLLMLLPESFATLFWLGLMAAVLAVTQLLFATNRLWISPGLFLASLSFVYLLTFLFKLDEVTGRLQKKWVAIADYLGTADPSRAVVGTRLSRLLGRVSLRSLHGEINLLDDATRLLLEQSERSEQINRELADKNRELAVLKEALEERVQELEEAIERVRQLEGLIPICMYCKKIRTDEDSWQRLETYFSEHTDVAFSHGICPDCFTQRVNELEDGSES